MRKSLLLLILVVLAGLQSRAGVYYWVGGTGNWSQFNTHWATTSGGNVFHIQTPTFVEIPRKQTPVDRVKLTPLHARQTDPTSARQTDPTFFDLIILF